MPTAAILILIVFSAMLAGVLVLRPAITIHPGGKILAFGVFFFLPVFCLMAGWTVRCSGPRARHSACRATSCSRTGRVSTWTMRRTLPRRITKTIAFPRIRRATRATRTMRCSEHSRQRWAASAFVCSLPKNRTIARQHSLA